MILVVRKGKFGLQKQVLAHTCARAQKRLNTRASTRLMVVFRWLAVSIARNPARNAASVQAAVCSSFHAVP